MIKSKFCIIMPAFHMNRISRAIDSLLLFDLGETYDILIMHNKFEPVNIVNRWHRTPEEIDQITDFGKGLESKYSNIKYFERNNIGEDIGAYRAGYREALKNNYEYYFFFSEMAVSKRGGWLKEYDESFQENKAVGLICPHICPGIRYTFAIKTSYFCIRKELFLYDWPEPRSRKDTELQEMEYFYPAVKKRNFYAMQYGNGYDHITYLNDQNKETHRKFLFRGKLLGNFLV